MKNIKAVILAGGEGSRLHPVTQEIPKPLLPVNQTPIINYLVNLFLNQGIENIAVLINQSFKEDFAWWKKRYYPESKIKIMGEKRPLGTLGGLYYLRKQINTPFFVTNGDELKEIDLSKMKRFHQKKEVLGTIALVKVPNPQDYGVVICKNEMIKKFSEKPDHSKSKYISSGLYLFSPEVLKYHPGPKYCMIETDLFPKLVQQEELAGYRFEGRWADCGTWKRYEKAINNWK